MTRRPRSPAIALGVGAVVGLVVAGAGSRLAMRLIALADDREDFGLPTEGGDIVGQVTLTGRSSSSSTVLPKASWERFSASP